MNVSSLRSAFANLLRKDLQKPLGRWKLDTCSKTVGRKVDYANEDHCGPCGIQKKSESKVSSTPLVNQVDLGNSKYYYYLL